MISKSKLLCVMVLCCFSFGVTMASEKVVFYLEDEPIYTSDDDERPGFLMEIVQQMTVHLDIEPHVEFLPWKRAQTMASSQVNAVIFPLSRTPSREDKYKWLCKVYDVPVAFISKQDKELISTLEKANTVRGLGVIRGTPQEEFLIEKGINHVAVEGKELFARLESDIYGAVYSGVPEAISVWNSQKLSGSLQFGPALQTLPLWIATSKQSSALKPEDWELALQKVKDSGHFQVLVLKYFGTKYVRH